jgi:HPt (histidine-containing phosphotransfer) domain-containing protein
MASTAVDLDELAERLGGDREALAELIEIFLEDAPTLVAEIRDGAEDLTRLRRAAHTLKGASGNMGAHAACETASRLQQAAASGDGPSAQRARVALLDEMARVLAELEASRVDSARRRAS